MQRKVSEEYLYSWDQEIDRPQEVNERQWQMMQSNDTKSLNLDKDFDGLQGMVQQIGWNDENIKRKQKRTARIKVALRSKRRWKA